jgi:hypothetical protein
VPEYVHGHRGSASFGSSVPAPALTFKPKNSANLQTQARTPAHTPACQSLTCKRVTVFADECSEASARANEKVPTNAVHMPRFHREEIASRANAVVLML